MPANYVLISEQTVNVPVASVTFSNIPQTGYTDLKIVMSVRTNRADNSDGILCKPNNSASNGTQILVAGSGSGSPISQSFSFIVAGTATAANDTANTFGNAEMYISNYNLTSTPKPMSVQGVNENNASTAFAVFRTNLWSDNSAITSLVFSPQVGTNFIANSTFSLYGIAALGTTPVNIPKASGGDIIVNDGTYWYHAFLASGVFMPSQSLSCDALVVAGGGGAVGEAGGGGAGGLRSATQSLTATNYAVIVGAGGRGTTGTPTQGSSSSFNSLQSAGGGAAFAGIAGGSGGSGAGGGTSGAATLGGAGNTPSTSPSQGNNGGNNGSTLFPYPGGGGGGAGAVGQTPTNQLIAGNGGAGVNTFSTWASATNTGASGFYAGGGGGGVYTNSGGPTAGSGGSGGGGAGGLQGATATSGTVNTGGGGGGSGQGGSGGAGGSGIVIVRYTMA
jgi:hypothetical protein